MLNDKYNYVLNGVEHEIILNNNLVINKEPIDEKILISNKYLIKYINDLFDYHNIEYFIINTTLLGLYIFNGINIFDSKIEICILNINSIKLKKIKNDIINDDFNIIFNENNIIISTVFFDNIKTNINIYLIENDCDNDIIKYNINNKLYIHNFSDIFPIKKEKFEEFYISVPNKIENILLSFNYNLKYIIFSNDIIVKNIIEKNDDQNKNIIEQNINKFISIIKPFFYK